MFISEHCGRHLVAPVLGTRAVETPTSYSMELEQVTLTSLEKRWPRCARCYHSQMTGTLLQTNAPIATLRTICLQVATSRKLQAAEVDSQSVHLRRGNPFFSWLCTWLPYGDFTLTFAVPDKQTSNVLFQYEFPWWSWQPFGRDHPGMRSLFAHLTGDIERALASQFWQVRISTVPVNFIPAVAQPGEVADGFRAQA